MRLRRLGFVVVVLAAVVGLLWSLGIGFPGAPEEIDAARVRRGDLEIALPVTGTFETRSVELSFEIPGRLAAVYVREGQALRAGQVVAAIDDREVVAAAEQAEAAARAAASEAQRAQTQVQAATAEAERTRAAVESARQQSRQAEAAWRAAQANLAQVQAGARPAELQQAQAALDAARAGLEQAGRNFDAQERLYREGAISSAQLDLARTQLETAEAQYRQAAAQLEALRAGARPEAVAAAREQVRQAEAAWQASLANVRQVEAAWRSSLVGVQQARTVALSAAANAQQAAAAARAARARAARARLAAPFDGVVTRVYLNVGMAVGPGVPVVSFAEPGGWVSAEVDEADIGRVSVGMPARVTADAYPGRIFTGRVTRIGRQVEVRLGSRVVRVRVDLDGPAGMRVGTSVDIDLILRTVRDAVLVPVEAVVAAADGGPHVYVVAGAVLRRRDVRTGESNDFDTVVVGGLREGEIVALADPSLLREGLRVRVRSVR
ncbi:MAG: efflux RND transporter periplasmic adaptor subunit [Armatimonadota bacterium]|nr:efflux RND transporter periplasmic adaptor subunit [Armatimonadota bacterium]